MLKAASIAQCYVGAPVPRKEDEALLTGRARFIDDVSPLPGLRFAAILRSPHPHARIVRIDASRARSLSGVVDVVTGSDLAAVIGPIKSVVKAPFAYFPIAIDRVRYVGEAVAVAVAQSRYIAEDACDLIKIEYDILPAAADLSSAMAENAPLVHEQAGSNVISRRSFRYGDPDGAFAAADRIFQLSHSYPRYASTPMETFGVIAHFERAPDRYTVWSNFQGPFVLQPLMAGALRVPGHRLRLITPPNSGGSFGIKQAIASYIVLFAAVSRKTGMPVKWVEDRAEHLTAASSSSDRMGTVSAAFSRDGELKALHFHNAANMGAYIRAPEPASLYRMHAASNGCSACSTSRSTTSSWSRTARRSASIAAMAARNSTSRLSGSWTSPRAGSTSIPPSCGGAISCPAGRFRIGRRLERYSMPATMRPRSASCCVSPITRA